MDVAAAVTVTVPLCVIALAAMTARVTGRMVLKASAPPPAMAMPPDPPPPMLTAAAVVVPVMVALLRASTRTAPVPASIPSPTLFTLARVAALMVLSASAKPIETATPFEPPKAALTAAVSALAVMLEVSAAFTVTAPALIALLAIALPPTPLPSMKAWVVTPMALMTAVAPPPARPAEIAAIFALMTFFDVASTARAPRASTPTRVRDASTTVPPFVARA